MEAGDADRMVAQRPLPPGQPRPACRVRGEHALLHLGQPRRPVARTGAGEERPQHRVGDQMRAFQRGGGGTVAAFLRGIGRDLRLGPHQPAQFGGGVDAVADDRLDEAVLARHRIPRHRDDLGIGQADQAVATAQHRVEEGEFMRARQRFQPERQLGEIDRQRVAVDAAQAMLRHQPLGMEQFVFVGGDGRALLRPAGPCRDQPFAQLPARLHEKRARPGGGIADLQVEDLRRAGIRADPRKGGGQRMGDDRAGQRRRGVMAAGAAAFVGRLQDRGARRHRDPARAGAGVGDRGQRRRQRFGGVRRAQRLRDRGGEGAAPGRRLQQLLAVAGFRRGQRDQIDPYRHAVVLARADRQHRSGGAQGGEAHHGFVHRPQLLDAERAIGDPFSAQHQQPVEHAQHAAIADRQHGFGIVGTVAPEQEGERRLAEQLAAARLHEARGVPAIDQPEQRHPLSPAPPPFVHCVGVERGVVAQPQVQPAQRIALFVQRGRHAARRRGHQRAVLGIEDEDQPQQDRQQPFVEVLRVVRRQRADALRIGGVEPAQQFVEAGEHLSRQPRRHVGLRSAAFGEQRGQAVRGRPGEQRVRVEQQFQPGEHAPSADFGQRGQRPAHMPRHLAARGDDQPQHGFGFAAQPPGLARADDHAHQHPGFAQQPFETLLRGRFPTVERAAAIEDDVAFDPHQQLRRAIGCRYRQMGLQQRVVFAKGDAQGFGQRRSARRARDVPGRPAQHVAEQRPWIVGQPGPRLRHCVAFGGPLRGGPCADPRQRGGGDDQPHRLQITDPVGQPLAVRPAHGVVGHR